MTTITLEPPKLHKSQGEVFHDPARFKVLACGRRWGKTRLGSLKCVALATQRKRVWWVAPSYKMAAVGWRLIKWLSIQVPGTRPNEADRSVTFANGGVIQVRSADDPQSLRGEGLDYVVLDECAYMKEEAWTEALRPALADREGGALFISTPKGHNFFHGLWYHAEKSGDPLWAARRLATWDNPYIPRGEIEIARSNLPELIFRQEFGAEFIEGIGALFDTGKIGILDYVPDCSQIVRFYDLAVTAKKHSDYTVGLKLGLWTDERIVILDVYRVQKPMPDVQNDIVQNAAMDGTNVRLRLEAEKAGIIQLDYLLRDPRMRGYAMDTQPPLGDKYTRATPAATRVNNERVFMVRGNWNRVFLDELAVFPMGEHDDQVDALSGAYEMLGTAPAWSAFIYR
jgi:predicted phage terminase large subunit-like protein